MTIHGEPPPWRKNIGFVGPRLDFEGSLYDDYDLIEPPVNFNLDDHVARRAEQLIHDMYGRTLSLLRQHHAALVKTVRVGFSLSLSKSSILSDIFGEFDKFDGVGCYPGFLSFQF